MGLEEALRVLSASPHLAPTLSSRIPPPGTFPAAAIETIMSWYRSGAVLSKDSAQALLG